MESLRLATMPSNAVWRRRNKEARPGARVRGPDLEATWHGDEVPLTS